MDNRSGTHGRLDGEREPDHGPVTSWLQLALARKYDAVLEERVPPEFERLLESCPGEK